MSKTCRCDGLGTIVVPLGILFGFVLACAWAPPLRERVFGPDYYTRSTPGYPGELSRYAPLNPFGRYWWG